MDSYTPKSIVRTRFINAIFGCSCVPYSAWVSTALLLTAQHQDVQVTKLPVPSYSWRARYKPCQAPPRTSSFLRFSQGNHLRARPLKSCSGQKREGTINCQGRGTLLAPPFTQPLDSSSPSFKRVSYPRTSPFPSASLCDTNTLHSLALTTELCWSSSEADRNFIAVKPTLNVPAADQTSHIYHTRKTNYSTVYKLFSLNRSQQE